MKRFEVQVSIPQRGRNKQPLLLDVELMASSQELAEKRTRYTLWSQHRHLLLDAITVVSSKELPDVPPT